MRNRMLNPEFWLDEDISKLSAFSRLLYMGLWGLCDDNFATFPNKPNWVKIQIFPFETVDVKTLLTELETAKKILPFEYKGEYFYFIKNFLRHQKIDRPSKPKFPPAPYEIADYSLETKEKAEEFLGNSRRTLVEPSTTTRPEKKRKEEKRNEVNRKEKNISREECLAFPLPPEINPDLWKDWIEYRYKTKKPFATLKSLQLHVKNILQFKPKCNEAIEQSLANGWQGIFYPRGGDSRTPIPTPQGKYTKHGK